MATIALSYSTTDGQTLRICQRLQQTLVAAGHAAQLIEIRSGAEALPAADMVVVGASIRYGHYRPALLRFVRAQRDALSRLPNAFFSVNLVARKPGRDQVETNPYVQKFLRSSPWQPELRAVFAGKLDYSRCTPLDRQIIRLIMWMTGGPTDPKACVEFTDWAQVERFAQALTRRCASTAVS